MQQNNRKPAVKRGINIELLNARVEISGGVKTSGTGKKFVNVYFVAPVNVDDVSDGEISFRTTLWEEKADKIVKVSKSQRFNVKGYYKEGRPFERDGKEFPTKDFVTTEITALKVATPAPVAPVEDDDIPF